MNKNVTVVQMRIVFLSVVLMSRDALNYWNSIAIGSSLPLKFIHIGRCDFNAAMNGDTIIMGYH